MRKMLFVMLSMAVLGLTACSGNSSTPSAGTEAKKTDTQAAESDSGEDSGGWVPKDDIEFIVGNSAGGGADLFTREVVSIIDQYKMCPTNITVVNKPGSSHVAGYTYLLDHGDDYHLDVTSASFFTQPVSGNSPFKFEDFSYVAMLCKDPNLLFAANNAPFSDFDGMIEYAKSNPGAVSAAGSSAYSDDAILCNMIQSTCGVELNYVTYESGADVLAAVMGGHVQLGILNPAEVGDNITAGNVKPIVVSAEKRVAMDGMEEVPTFKEAGVDIEHEQPRGFVMSNKASQEAVQYYADLLGKVAETPEWKEYLQQQCMEEEVYLAEDWEKVAKGHYVEVYTEYVGRILADTNNLKSDLTMADENEE
ncbi:tripartite tricarboxylate transporter substrate binding protein [Clostridium sp. AM58-1XD]|uniref:tripartite tricarboxylate transporter substrate binding protein n=1 Tax=Clostridium sp. AM58-1XD TaxID=2292307 RepID=UPI000E474323|nr:tripartite tricarboxylate transporter substrate binding protein [Clostridium sp. AM58-1XD]RGY98878.1 tripartite tricarboxylate transporter substrate binding protein [Clostridium sp. AM58-1XD]